MPLGTIGLELCEKLQSQFLYPLEPTVMTEGNNFNPVAHPDGNGIKPPISVVRIMALALSELKPDFHSIFQYARQSLAANLT